MIIAVDFDGTIVEHRYPQIGKEIPFAVATLKKLSEDGHTLVLWTVREGELLDEAVKWCEERGLHFFAVNKNFDEDSDNEAQTSNNEYSRKLKAQIFIDDRNIGGLPDWGVIYQLITRRISYQDYLREENLHQTATPKKKSRWKFF
jgi:hydroxymethylpyrimidine pyrophosphatase-like HAD family hydrolase